MRYCPVSIRFKTDKTSDYVSGIYMLDNSTEYMLSVCPTLVDRIRAHPEGDLMAALGSGISDTHITWDEIKLELSIPLNDTSIFLNKFAGFKLSPSKVSTLDIFKFERKSAARRNDTHANYLPLDISVSLSDLQNSNVRILSCPFGGVNSALFIGYESPAVVSYVTPDGQTILLDGRYLDDMEGAIVNDENGKSLGLVCGYMAKASGEGKLITGITWPTIIAALRGKSIFPELKNMAILSPVAADCSSNAVALVYAKLRGGRHSWGSGVLVARDIVVTNKHVPGDNFLSIEVCFGDSTVIQAEAVAEPISGVDLVLLRLAQPVDCIPAILAPKNPTRGSTVLSHGYGLLYPGRGGSIRPLFSRGIIAASYFGSIYDNQISDQCSMLVSTAGCWNGSSGGGLFNEANEVVGIMASNARDESTGEIMHDMAFVIPVNIVCLALQCVKDGTRLTATKTYQRLWNLEPTHVDSKRLRPRL